MITSHNLDRDWNARYAAGELPWDSGLPSRELANVLQEYEIPPGRALELGCGTGTNAIWLAQLGFDVTAVDVAPNALRIARDKATTAGVAVTWIEADAQNFGSGREPFDFVFDRGCYHCCRRTDLQGYVHTLKNVTHIGTKFLCLCGNIGEQSDSGIPRVAEDEIRRELGWLFEFVHLRSFHFEDAGGAQGPLGWSVLMVRTG